MKMKVLIVDDERPAREELKYLLNRYDFIEVSGEAENSRKALEQACKKEFDIAFLDIDIRDMNGFILAESLLNLNPSLQIIFATAYDQYAVKAFEINAVDYVLKPFSQERLQKTLERIVANRKNGNANGSEVIKPQASGTAICKLKKIPIKFHNRVMLVDCHEIICIKTMDKESLIVTNKGEFSTTHTLCELESRLDSGVFFRTHRSFIVNINYIKEIIPWFNNTYQLVMEGYKKERVPVSRSNIREFKLKLGL